MNNKVRLVFFPVILLVVSTVFTLGHAATLITPQTVSAGKKVPDRILVRFKPNTPAAAVNAAHAGHSPASEHSFAFLDGLKLFVLPPGTDLQTAIDRYQKNPNVLYVEPDYEMSATATNDSSYAQLWALKNTGQTVNGTAGTNDADMNIEEAWTNTGVTGSNSVVIAVIDSGVQYNHPDLQANMWVNPGEIASNGIDDDNNGYIDDVYGINAITNSGNPMDDNNHGTHVAGTIAAVGNNSAGITGVVQQAKIIACKFLSASGSGSSSDSLKCLDYIYALKMKGINIIATNNSWGGGGGGTQSVADAIDKHRQAGILFVAAAGNDGADNDGTPHYPANYYKANIISVAATTQNDTLASFSDYGRLTVHVGAPGVNIYSTIPTNSYTHFQGTSMATPNVTGLIALLSAQDPTRDWRTLKNLVIAGGTPIGALSANTITGRRVRAWDSGTTPRTGAMTCANQVVTSKLYPQTSSSQLISGMKLGLAVLNINCATPNGTLNVTTTGPAAVGAVTLQDDGLGFDQAAGDGIYSGYWTAPSTAGSYTLTYGSTGQTQTVTVSANSSTLIPYRAPVSITYNPRVEAGVSFGPLADNEYAGMYPCSNRNYFGGSQISLMYAFPKGVATLNDPFYLSLINGTNSPLPHNIYETVIAGYWDDLDLTGAGNGFRAWAYGACYPNADMVFEWKGVIKGTSTPVQVQMVFVQDSSDIEMHYISTANNADSATVGIQVDFIRSTTQSFNNATSNLAAGKAWRWKLDNGAPTANAGTAQNVNGNSLVTLSGSGSDTDGGTLSYSWTQISGTPASLTGANTLTPTFYAPNVTGTLVFQLAVTDDANQTTTSTVNINVTAVAAAGSLALSATTYSVNETAGSAVVSITRTGGSTGTVGLTYATADGTASAGSDYVFTSGTLTWASGDTSTKTFSIPITNDSLTESNETLSIILSNPTGGASLGTANATLTINDVAPAYGNLAFSNTSYSVNETGGSATITVSRTGGSTGAVSVNYATSNGTATAGSDYTSASGTLSFADGVTSKTFTVSITDDATYEGNETVLLSLSSVSGGATLGTNSATLTIVDNESAPSAGSLGFSSSTYSVNESGSTTTITVSRTGGTAGAVSVNYSTANGTATAGSDYTAASGTLSFADGETSKTFTVSILDDTTYEGDETVLLSLSSVSGGATLGTSSATLSIIENDSPPAAGVLSFNSTAYSVAEDAGSITITVTRSGGSLGAVSVNYATANGTATSGSDYTAASGTLNFANGETSHTFSVAITNDSTPENDETVLLSLTSATNGAVIGAGSATLTITNYNVVVPDPAVISIESSTYSVNENSASVTITINRSGNTAGAMTVDYVTANGTATSTADYSAVSGTINFAAGDTSASVSVTINDDTQSEGDETFTFTISNVTAGATLGTSAATVTIVDNEGAANRAPNAPTLVSPTNGNNAVNGSSVTFKWNEVSDSDGDTVSYDLYYCTDATFTGCSPTKVAKVSVSANTVIAGLGGSMGLAMIGLVGAMSNRRRYLNAAIIVVASIMMTACGANLPPLPGEKATTVTGLASKTTYYWKVVASDGKGGTAESAVWSFTTL